MKTELDFKKGDGLIPAIIQHSVSGEVLMLGYMNQAALEKTKEIGLVTFYSRSKERLWTKGETSGNELQLVEILADCDADALLVQALPKGPACHKGTRSCFGDKQQTPLSFISKLEKLIQTRKKEMPQGSYTTSLFEKGVAAAAQKVGEEAVEVVIASVGEEDQAVLAEAADLLYHFLVLLCARELSLSAVCGVLEQRHSDG